MHGEAGEKLLALAFELFGAEGGMQHDVGHQIETRGEIFFHYVEADVRGVGSGGRFERAADEIDGFGDFFCGAPLGALREHVRGHLRDAGHSLWILHGTRGGHQQADGYGRLAVVGDDVNAKSVRESFGGGIGEVKLFGRARRRHFRNELHTGRDDAGAFFLLA